MFESIFPFFHTAADVSSHDDSIASMTGLVVDADDVDVDTIGSDEWGKIGGIFGSKAIPKDLLIR